MKAKLFKGYMAIIYAMILLFFLVSNFTARTEEQWRFFYAFTQQSNIIVLIWLILFGINTFKPTKFNFVRNKTLMVAITVYISITFFIVAFVLDPFFAGKFQPAKSTGELILHNLTPIVMWIYFFIVKGEGELNIKKTPLVLIYPLAYVVLNLVVGGTVKYLDGTSAYAYGFINPASYGGNYFLFIGALLGLILIFSLFSILLSKLKNKIDSVE